MSQMPERNSPDANAMDTKGIYQSIVSSATVATAAIVSSASVATAAIFSSTTVATAAIGVDISDVIAAATSDPVTEQAVAQPKPANATPTAGPSHADAANINEDECLPSAPPLAAIETSEEDDNEPSYNEDNVEEIDVGIAAAVPVDEPIAGPSRENLVDVEEQRNHRALPYTFCSTYGRNIRLCSSGKHIPLFSGPSVID